MRLLVRPQPYSDESLESYLLRLCLLYTFWANW